MTTHALPEIVRIPTPPSELLQPGTGISSAVLSRLFIEYAELNDESAGQVQPSQFWPRLLWHLTDLDSVFETDSALTAGWPTIVAFGDEWEFTESWPSHLMERLRVSLDDDGRMSFVWPHSSHNPLHVDLQTTEPVAPYNCPLASPHSAGLSQSSQIWPLLRRLADLYSTPENAKWPDADWPTKAAFEDAWEFTTRLPLPLRELPHISLADDGEVNFAWSGGTIYIDLGFYGAEVFSYYGRDSNGREFFGDDIPVTSPLPEDLVSLLTA